SSRDVYNEFRWSAIHDSPIYGFGFVHRDAALTDRYRLMDGVAYAERFSVIDSGYVDLLIKFGYLGAGVYLMMWFRVVYYALYSGFRGRPLNLLLGLFLLQYYAVSLTWSVFSYAHGLVPAFIALFTIWSNERGGSGMPSLTP